MNKKYQSHGHSNRTPTYITWEAMNQRCNNPRHNSYSRYGGRGIKVCERWRIFANFLEDMGERIDKNYSLERLNNDGNYEASNCAWVLKRAQYSNKQNSHYLEFQGKTQIINEWARELKMNSRTIHERLKRGWSVEKTLSTPKMKCGPKPKNNIFKYEINKALVEGE